MEFIFLISFLTFFWIQATSKYVVLADPADKYVYDAVNGTQVGIFNHDEDKTKSKDPGGNKCEPYCEPANCEGYDGYQCYNKICHCYRETNSSDCFSIQDTVMTPSGRKRLGDIGANDLVLTVSDEGRLKYESVLLDAHPRPDRETLFLKIKTPNRDIMLTPKHFIYVGETTENSKPVKSEDVQVGDSLLIHSFDRLKAEKVEEIEMVRARGISNHLMSSGKLLVNDVLASVYSDIAPTTFGAVHQHQLAWMIRQCFKFGFEHVFEVRGGNGVPLVANYFFQHLVGVKLWARD